MEQVLFGGIYTNISFTAYNTLQGGEAWPTVEKNPHGIVSTSGVIKNFRVKLDGSPGGTDKYTFTLMLNGSITALTFDIVGAATTGSNMVNEIDVVPGDTVTIKADPIDTPTARRAAWTSVFEGATANESLIIGGHTVSLDTGITEYFSVMHFYGSPTSNENDKRQVVPTAGTIRNLYVVLDDAPGGGDGAYRFTLRKGTPPGAQGNTTLTVTITTPSKTGNDSGNSFTVAAGDVVTLQVEPIDGPSGFVWPVWWGMTFVADIDGESIVLGGSTNDLDAAATEYIYSSSPIVTAWASAENERYQLGQVCTLKKLHILLSATPGAGKDRDFAIRIAGTNIVTLQISDTETTGDSGALEDTVALDEYVNLRTIPTGTPNVADAYWGFVSYIAPPTVGIPVQAFMYYQRMRRN